MMRRVPPSILAVLAMAGVLASPLAAQLQVPDLPGQVTDVRGVVDGVTGQAGETLGSLDSTVAREAGRLLRLRDETLGRLLARNRDSIERDADGNLARRGTLLVTGATPEALAALEAVGFTIAGRESVEGLDLDVIRIAVPDGMSLARAQGLAAKTAPGADISADSLHYAAASPAPAPPAGVAMMAAPQGAGTDIKVGMIDSGSGKGTSVASQRGFAKGAPVASDHGNAVASLLRHAGVRQVWVADVYGDDPAGGNALAIAKALGWLVSSGCKVVTISLVGPRNAVVERAVAAAQGRGVVVVAAVGNDGPAAPPAYPASYDNVVSITGVDRKGRALIEAGRAAHLDYAAPGAGVYALDAAGRAKAMRGTSFAAPLAAARLAAAIGSSGTWRTTLDAEARDLGKKGPDARYGRGLLCERCAEKK